MSFTWPCRTFVTGNAASVAPATSCADQVFSLKEVAITRLVTAIVVLPLLVLFLLKAGPGLFAVLVALCTLLGLHEYLTMVLPSARSGLVRVASVAGAFVPCIVLFRIPFALPAAMTFLFLATAIHVLLQPDDIRNAASETALTVAGYLYVPLLLAHLVLLRLLPHGIDWVFLLLFIVMMSDTCAYYLGSRFGRHKLYPAVSPNKSVEGAAGGLLGALVGALLCRVTFFAELNVMDCFYIAVAGGSLAQVGDLFESLLKRSCGVKDSGTIIPGHGGMLDRLDSILFAAPLIYYYALIVFYGRVGF